MTAPYLLIVRKKLRSSRIRGLPALAAAACLSTVSCAPLKPATQEYTGRPWVEADALFHRDPRWLGSDAALSIPLGGHRTLWLFGDTFVASSPANTRSESTMIRNTVALQTGDNPLTATIAFSWRKTTEGLPASFFSDSKGRWYWPGHGIRLAEGPLAIFLYAVAESKENSLGFVCAGYALAVIDNPDTPVDTWQPRIVEAAPGPLNGITPSAVIQDGAYVVTLVIRQKGAKAGLLARHPAAALEKGDLSQAEWWAGDGRGWVPEAKLGSDEPAVVMEDAGAECSLHWDPRTISFIHVASYGFGASTVGMRSAPALTGPWNAPVMVYRPPESDGSKPFVYAAKAHPELVGPNPTDLVVTYATNSFTCSDLFTKEGKESIYWPRFALVPMPPDAD